MTRSDTTSPDEHSNLGPPAGVNPSGNGKIRALVPKRIALVAHDDRKGDLLEWAEYNQDILAGHSRFEAIIGATVRRFRPITLTAAAAVLALIPLLRSNFFGPMATALMGGITVATILTLVYLPALYALWFRVRRDEPAPVAAT